MTDKQVLVRTRGLIERGWTQGTFARDAKEVDVDPTHFSACKWCAVGAVWKVVGFNARETYIDTCAILDEITEFNTVSEFNDHADTTQADMLAVFDEAIARCE